MTYIYAARTPSGYVVEWFGGARFVSRVRRRYFHNEQDARRIAFRWLDEIAHRGQGRAEPRGLVRRWASDGGWNV